jgi:hypothetical protein
MPEATDSSTQTQFVVGDGIFARRVVVQGSPEHSSRLSDVMD